MHFVGCRGLIGHDLKYLQSSRWNGRSTGRGYAWGSMGRVNGAGKVYRIDQTSGNDNEKDTADNNKQAETLHNVFSLCNNDNISVQGFLRYASFCTVQVIMRSPM